MTGCIGNTVKYLLFATNFIVFILGCCVLGVGIWVLVDSDTFMELFKKVDDLLPDHDMSINIYSTAAYLLIAVAVIIIIITFFGCCGAIKESKCMLGTYFCIVLVVFIMCIVGAVLGYSGNLEDNIKDPFIDAIQEYDDSATENGDAKMKAKYYFKVALNNAQKDFACCGINNVEDWINTPSHNFNWDPPTANKPEGCCGAFQNGTELTGVQISTCRSVKPALNHDYNFDGCYTKFEKKIKDNQDVVIGIAIGVVVVMFLNMLFAFAMCTISGK